MGIVEVFSNPQVKFLLLQESGFGAALDYFLGDATHKMNPQLQQKSTEKEEEYEVTNKAI
jgi:hypothetical protein